MITIHAGTTVIVSNYLGELVYPPGVWVVSEIERLRPGTNQYLTLALRDGSTVSVDSFGWVDINQPAPLANAAMQGVILALLLVGVWSVMRWALRVFNQAERSD